MINATLENIAVAGEGNQFLVLLKTDEDDILPIVVGPLEAMSIAAGKLGDTNERPMTHDLMLSTFELLGASVKRIEITDLVDGTFYAHLILENRGIELDIDARPSDAMALAVRTGVPILIAPSVLDEAALEDVTDGTSSFEA
ncbi:MAG: bifunctional nuclease family protein [Deinococcota bacterium]